MTDVTYEIVQHDGGWAYKVNGVFSESFPTHADTLAAGACEQSGVAVDAMYSRYENEPQGHTALGRTQTRCPARIATMRGVFMNMAVATTIISDS
jgi:hypothetical protein